MMRATKKTLLALSAALAACVTATLLLAFAPRGETVNDQAPIYYFTNYASPDELLLASVENDTGSVALAASDGAYYASGNTHLPADEAEVEAFFSTMYRLPMKRLLEGADASDPQYGLIQPRAEVLLQDVRRDGVLFRIGSETPDGEGCYACLSGDARVFVMDRAYARPLLSNVSRFYDLSLYPPLTGDGVCHLHSVSVRRGGKTAYTLQLSAASGSGGTAVFAMTEPYSMVLGVDQAKSEVLTPLRELKGTSIVEQAEDLAAYGLADHENCFTLTFDDESSVVIRVGKQEGAETYVLREDNGMILQVPTVNLSFFRADAMQLVGRELVSVSMGDLRQLQIGGLTFGISGTPPALDVTKDGSEFSTEEFQSGVFAALNHISLQGEWADGKPSGAPLLELTIQTEYVSGSAQSTAYAFYAQENRRCGVTVNGRPAFLCSSSAVQRLIDAAS